MDFTPGEVGKMNWLKHCGNIISSTKNEYIFSG